MYQLKMESTKYQNVYRTILVPGSETFLKLSYYTMSAFNIESVKEPIFETVVQNGKRKIINIDALEENEYPVEQQIIKDWFQKQGDQMYFIVDSNTKVKITLEKNLFIPLKSDVPICIDGHGELFTGTLTFIDFEKINAEFQFYYHLSNGIQNEVQEDEEPDYQGLLQLSDEVKKLKPWEYFENDDVFVLDVTKDLSFYVCIMGAAGQEYGLMIFDLNHYDTLYSIISGQPLPEDFHFNIEMMTVNFVNRDELTKEDYQLIKDNGFSFRGKKNWIQFRVYNRGLVPAIPNNSMEVENLRRILSMLLDVLSECKKGWKYPSTKIHEYPFFYYEDGEINDGLLELKKIRQHPLVPLNISKKEKEKYKRKPKLPLRIEFDVKYLPNAVPVESINRLGFPILGVVVEKETGVILSHRIVTVPKIPQNVQWMLWDLLNDFDGKPTNIIVSKEIKPMVKSLEKDLGLKITVGELKGIKEFYESAKSIF